MKRTAATLTALTIFLITALTAAAAGTPTNPNDPAYWENQFEHPARCYKHEGDSSHGTITDDGKGVVLNDYNPSWPGDHWEALIVKGGNVDNGAGPGNVVYWHPEAGQRYESPDNASGRQSEVSHWIVCKGWTPPPTTTTTTSLPPSTTTSTTSTTTTSVPPSTTTTEPPPSTTTTSTPPSTTTSTTTSTTIPTTTTTTTIPVTTTTIPVVTTTTVSTTTTSTTTSAPPSTTTTTTKPPATTTTTIPETTTTTQPPTLNLDVTLKCDQIDTSGTGHREPIVQQWSGTYTPGLYPPQFDVAIKVTNEHRSWTTEIASLPTYGQHENWVGSDVEIDGHTWTMEVIIDGEVAYTETTTCPLPPVETTTTTTTTVVPPSTLPVTGGGDIVGTSLELTDLAPIAVVLVGLGVVLLGLGLGVQASREAT